MFNIWRCITLSAAAVYYKFPPLLSVTGWLCHPGDVEWVYNTEPIFGTMIASISRDSYSGIRGLIDF
jgi:hypothetical protein